MLIFCSTEALDIWRKPFLIICTMNFIVDQSLALECYSNMDNLMSLMIKQLCFEHSKWGTLNVLRM